VVTDAFGQQSVATAVNQIARISYFVRNAFTTYVQEPDSTATGPAPAATAILLNNAATLLMGTNACKPFVQTITSYVSGAPTGVNVPTHLIANPSLMGTPVCRRFAQQPTRTASGVELNVLAEVIAATGMTRLNAANTSAKQPTNNAYLLLPMDVHVTATDTQLSPTVSTTIVQPTISSAAGMPPTNCADALEFRPIDYLFFSYNIIQSQINV
jgi:hypothetical protein